ncbi:L-aspartate oxidase [Desulfotruncus alcoholivorax]|uniref:L-aspartate oxidase n=1 Tax=Desulfotruncus alcoholivorax TaxID=265477 RepID=UPI00040F89DF|nr:FAD-binding protein [Desulfotruncus alcoholivorax]
MNHPFVTMEENTDVLVIGGGLAGLMAAIEAARIAQRVTVVTKGKVGKSGNTIMSRNGIAAVLEEGFDGDSIESHIKDTMKAGQHINNPDLVRVFAGNASIAINRLLELGVPFLFENGRIMRKGSPGHSHKRFLTADGSSVKSPQTRGLALTLPLAREAARLGVHHVEGVVITGLLVAGDRIAGARGYSKQGDCRVFKAGTVILACGGAGSLYPVTTNAADVTGDGYALARLVGARLTGMEFVQFHPAVALGSPKMVMSTSPFADGAVLRNQLGERFMARYSPDLEMATRDITARAIYREIKEGRGSAAGGVWMDFSAVPGQVMQSKYGDLYRYLGGRKKIEVAPAVHFMMGGVEIDVNCRTSVKGLYAAGETAGGLHGANRLAGNALAEAAVFGMIAGQEAAAEAMAINDNHVPPVDQIMPASAGGGSKSSSTIRKELRRIIGAKVGLIRSVVELKSAVDQINNLKEEISHVQVQNWADFIEYRQVALMLEAGMAVAEAALARKESLGAHYIINNKENAS